MRTGEPVVDGYILGARPAPLLRARPARGPDGRGRTEHRRRDSGLMTDHSAQRPDRMPRRTRRFAGVSNPADGEVGSATVFTHHEHDGTVRADCAGGAVRKGSLVGTRTDATLTFRYVRLGVPGRTTGGTCASRIEVLAGDRVRLHGSRAWEPRPGSGTGVVQEIRWPARGHLPPRRCPRLSARREKLRTTQPSTRPPGRLHRRTRP